MSEVTKKDRPDNCRNALKDAGEPYPRSGCAACGNGGMMGCPYERHREASVPAKFEGKE